MAIYDVFFETICTLKYANHTKCCYFSLLWDTHNECYLGRWIENLIYWKQNTIFLGILPDKLDLKQLWLHLSWGNWWSCFVKSNITNCSSWNWPSKVCILFASCLFTCFGVMVNMSEDVCLSKPLYIEF